MTPAASPMLSPVSAPRAAFLSLQRLRPYQAILSARFRALLQYRAAALAGISTQLFFGLVRVMIFEAFYRSATTGTIQPMSVQETITYIWLGQAFLLLVMFGVDADLAAMIRSGTIAYEMVRPVDLYNLWYARAIANRAAPTLMRALPILVLSAFLGMQAPVSFTALGLFVVSLLAALLLAAALTTLLTISLLWTISGEGVARLAPAIIIFFSGIIIPLPLFPAWMQPFLAILPFRGLIDTPFRIYLGQLPPSAALLALGQQLLWITAFMVLGRWLLSRGLKHLVVQGG